ncbi:hypothetical protein JCM1840_003645 [Sporobolomyces johnsonii]
MVTFMARDEPDSAINLCQERGPAASFSPFSGPLPLSKLDCDYTYEPLVPHRTLDRGPGASASASSSPAKKGKGQDGFV